MSFSYSQNTKIKSSTKPTRRVNINKLQSQHLYTETITVPITLQRIRYLIQIPVTPPIKQYHKKSVVEITQCFPRIIIDHYVKHNTPRPTTMTRLYKIRKIANSRNHIQSIGENLILAIFNSLFDLLYEPANNLNFNIRAAIYYYFEHSGQELQKTIQELDDMGHTQQTLGMLRKFMPIVKKFCSRSSFGQHCNIRKLLPQLAKQPSPKVIQPKPQGMVFNQPPQLVSPLLQISHYQLMTQLPPQQFQQYYVPAIQQQPQRIFGQQPKTLKSFGSLMHDIYGSDHPQRFFTLNNGRGFCENNLSKDYSLQM